MGRGRRKKGVTRRWAAPLFFVSWEEHEGEHQEFCSGTHKKSSCTIMAVFLFSINVCREPEKYSRLLCVTNSPSSCRMEGVRKERWKTMYLIAGLGNPGQPYEGTRHNVGFAVIDVLAEAYNISVDHRKNRALIGKGIIEGQKVILAKPQTYMNLSGESIRGLVDYYKVDEESELIVIYDDVSLDPGQIRIRKKGSAGGHNGIKSIIAHLGTEVFPRVKVGVGQKPRQYDLADYVLGHFFGEEREQMAEGFRHAAEAVKYMVTDRVDEAMNEYNRKVRPKEL